MNLTFEYCQICNRKIHDWKTHIKSSEHQRNVKTSRNSEVK
jgi:hypothetical protein